MSFYDLSEEQQRAMNVDYDFVACIEYNIDKKSDGWDLSDVERVIAVVEGEHDGASFHWIARLTGDRYVYMTGGCDYTGWD